MAKHGDDGGPRDRAVGLQRGANPPPRERAIWRLAPSVASYLRRWRDHAGRLGADAGRRVITITDGPGLGGPWGVAVSRDGMDALVSSTGQGDAGRDGGNVRPQPRHATDVQVYDGRRGRSVFYGVAGYWIGCVTAAYR
jgi:hypothetical protein